MTATDGSTTNFSINDLELFDETGLNVAQGGTASASTVSGSDSAANAFGGSVWDENRWTSTTSGTSWLQYDFGSGVTKEILGICIHATSTPNRSPKDFTVDYSNDGSSWTTAWTVTGSSSWSNYESRAFFSPSYIYTGSAYPSFQYWRLYARNATDGIEVQLADLEFRASPGGSDQTSGGTAIAWSSYSGYPAIHAFDADTNSTWASAQGGVTYIGYNFPSAVKVAEVSMIPRPGLPGRGPQYFKIQGSSSLSGPWTTAFSSLEISGWATGVYKTFTDPEYV